jgi:hypothetical protein
MQCNIKKELYLNFTLNSSEAIMFNEGGKHSVNIKEAVYEEDMNFDEYSKIEVSFQLSKDDRSRFDFIAGEAKKHREQWDRINEEERKTTPPTSGASPASS